MKKINEQKPDIYKQRQIHTDRHINIQIDRQTDRHTRHRQGGSFGERAQKMPNPCESNN